MIVLPQLYQHVKQDVKNAIHHLHYGLGRQYKIQIYKGFEHPEYGNDVTAGNAVMFTIQQMSATIHLKENNDIRQVKEWFNQTTQGVDIHVIDNKKYDIFVIALRSTKPIEKPIEVEPEWTAIDATGLAEEPKQDEEAV